MKKEIVLKLMDEFDGVLEYSNSSLSNEPTFCVYSGNSDSRYVLKDYQIYSNKPRGSFGFVNSLGKISLRTRESITPIMGTNCIYLIESGWISTDNSGKPRFYVLDLAGIKKWEHDLEGTTHVTYWNLREIAVS